MISRNKRLLITLSVVLSLVVFITFLLPRIVSHKLDRELEKTLDGYYKLTYGSNQTSLGLQGFNISFSDVKLSSDLSKSDYVSRFPVAFFETKLFEVKHIKVFDLLFSSKLDISSVLIDRPDLTLVVPESQTLRTPEKTPSIEKTEIPEDLKNALDKLSLGNFEIAKGKVSLVFMSAPKDTLRVGENIQIRLEELAMDLNQNKNVFKASTSKQLYFSLDNLLFQPEDGSMRYSLDNMYFDYKKGELQALNLKIAPRADWKTLNAKEFYQKTFKEISLDTLKCTSSNFETLEDLKLFKAQSLDFVNLNAKMYRDKSKPTDETKNNAVLQQVLLNLPIDLIIDSVNIRNASIRYTMVDHRKSDKPAYAYLDEIHGSMSTINTTDSGRTSSNLRFEGIFMKESPFKLEASLPMKTHAKHNFHFELGKLTLINLNPLLALSNIQLTAGEMDYIHYTGDNTDFVSTGRVTTTYRDFKMLMTNEHNQKKWLKSGLANLVVRNQNKEDKDGQPVTFPFKYERPPYRGHIDLLTGALIDGIARAMLPKIVYTNIKL